MELELVGLFVGAAAAIFSVLVGNQVLEAVEREQRKRHQREADQIEAAIRAVNNNNKALALEAVRKLGKMRGLHS